MSIKKPKATRKRMISCFAQIVQEHITGWKIEEIASGAAKRGDVRAQASLRFLDSVFARCVEEGRLSWEDVVVPNGRDRRFSNGVVIGSPEFVARHAPRPQSGPGRSRRPNHIVGNVYSSHGQRSAPTGVQAA